MDLFKKHENNVTKQLCKILRYMFLVFPVLLLVSLLGIFKIETDYFYVFIPLGFIVCFIPTLLLTLHVPSTIIKYVAVLSIGTIIFMLSANRDVGIYITYIMMPLLATMYFDKKFNIPICLLGYVMMACGLYLRSPGMVELEAGAWTGTVMDWYIAHLLGYTIEYIVTALVIFSIVGHAKQLLVDLNESHEQRAFERAELERIGAEQTQEFNRVLVEIAKSSALYSGDLKNVANTITQKGCHILKTSRLEVWQKVEGMHSLKNISTYEMSGGYIENRPNYEMENFEKYELMHKTERLFTTNNPNMYEIFLSTRDSLSAKSIASIEAPIWIDGDLAGAICFEQEACEDYPKKRTWTQEEHSFTTALADYMTIVMVNAERRRLEEAEAAIRAEKERIGAELNVATQIQASMLPCIFPAFPDHAEFDIFASMLPAKEVGGDFYDFFLVDENTLAIVMADVSGKGVPAALFMVIAKTLIKNNAQYGKSPKEVFEIVNNLLYENNEAGMFVTAFMGYLDIPSGKFTYVNAGHNPPLVRSGTRFDWLKTKPGFVLAGMEDMFYKQSEIILQPGDEMFLYTDGVTEAVNNEKELFSDPLLLETVNKFSDLALKEFTVSIKREIDKFAEGAEQADDITMLALRYKGLEGGQ